MKKASKNPLKLKTETTDSGIILYVSGSVGIADSEKLKSKLVELAEKKTETIVLELSKMGFICSTGLGAIISGHLKCRQHNGRIRLVNPAPPVRKLLEMTHLTKIFDIFPGVEQALEK